MGKKRILTYDCNEDDKPPSHIIIDNHNHHHQHRHNNHQKSKKIKPDAKLLHTLSSHLKKLGKSRSRNTHLFSTPPPPPPPTTTTTISHEKRKQGHGYGLQCDRDHHRVRFKGIDNRDHEGARLDNGDEMGVFEFGKDLRWKTMLSENNEDLFGGDCVFAPDLNASRKKMVVFEEDGFGCGSHIPDPVVKCDNGEEGNCLYDILKLSSQEEMLDEFSKVNLFVS